MEIRFDPFDLTLRDGRAVHVRTMIPTDEAALLAAFERMSPEARYMRFMRVVGAPNVERLRRALDGFPESGQGIIAVTGAGEVAGSATFLVGSDPATCEFATVVDGDYAGLGLGRALLTALIGAAKGRGLKEMEGFVLASNQPMLHLAAKLGFAIRPDPDDLSVRLCRLSLVES